MHTIESDYVTQFLHVFDKNLNLNSTNSLFEDTLSEPCLLLQTGSEFLDKKNTRELETIFSLDEFDFLKDKPKDTCVIIGGGKTVEYFDFSKLESLSAEKPVYIGINAGSCYHKCDIMFLSGQIAIKIPLPDGTMGQANVNGGLFNQFPCAYSAERSQLVVVPYIFDTKQQYNRDLAEHLSSNYSTVIKDIEYSDRWSTMGIEVHSQDFFDSIREKKLYGAGPDFGFIAICCALMWGFKKIFLVGFDGRFLDLFKIKKALTREEFLGSMWADDRSTYHHQFPDEIPPEQFDATVKKRNKMNRKLFHHLKRYCKNQEVSLRFLTPSIYADPEYYHEL